MTESFDHGATHDEEGLANEIRLLREFVAAYDRECEQHGTPFNFALRDARRAIARPSSGDGA